MTAKRRTTSTNSKDGPLLLFHCRLQSINSLINVISKISAASAHGPQQKGQEPPPSPAVQPTKGHSSAMGPSLSTSSVPGSMDTSHMGLSEVQLKRQGLECLVTVLRSLVTWGTGSATKPGPGGEDGPNAPSRPGNDHRDSIAPDTSGDRLAAGASTDMLRQPTPEVTDDPSKFESAKQRKITQLEGIKKFNSKPKRVWIDCFHSMTWVFTKTFRLGHRVLLAAWLYTQQVAPRYCSLLVTHGWPK